MTLQELLGIEFPIIQAPMAGVQGSELTVAVSNAGGLGSRALQATGRKFSLRCALSRPTGTREKLGLEGAGCSNNR